MSDHGTAIGWTHVPGYKGETWNPVTGCDRVSPGCAHCYALELASRLKGMGQPRYQKDGDPKTSGPGFGLTVHPDKLDDPLRWKAPRAIFVNSMSDVFHEQIPWQFVAEMFAVMSMAPRHIFMVLTKRPEWMRQTLGAANFWLCVNAARMKAMREVLPGGMSEWAAGRLTLSNVWLGVTIENRRFVDRADLLRETPAAVRFISAEPLLGPLIADRWTSAQPCSRCGWTALAGEWGEEILCHGCQHPLDLTGIDWVITGGESGPRHRRFDSAWAIQLRDACAAAGVAFLHKQNGGPRPNSNGRLLDGRTHDEFPVAVP